MVEKNGTGSAAGDLQWDNDGELILTGSSNAYIAKTARRIQGNYLGLRFCGRANHTSSGAATIKVDEAPAVAIRKSGNAAIAAGDIVSGVYYDFVFDDANGVMQILDVTTTLTAGDGIIISGAGAIATTIKRRNISDISGGGTMIATDRAKTVNIASGTGTLAFTAAATLGDGWWSIIKNSGTGDVTLDPASSEQIDGLTTWILYPGGSILVMCDGSGFNSVLLSPMEKTFNASGTFTKPGVGIWCEGHIWGAGGAGAKGAINVAGGGGGGGACTPFKFLLSQLGTTETITIGAGAVAISAATTNGGNGNNTTLGSLLTGFGGGGGIAATPSRGGAGGGSLSAAVTTTAGGPVGDDLGFNSGFGGTISAAAAGAAGQNSAYGGASGGNGDAATGGAGGAALWGGAGGGAGGDSAAGGAGGTSRFGGAGGAGATGTANATAGTQPGGGGGGAEGEGGVGNSGAGGDGRLTIRVC